MVITGYWLCSNFFPGHEIPSMEAPLKAATIISCIIALLAFGAASGDSTHVSEYSIVNRIPLTGDGGWDYCAVDDSTGRLFVSHGTQVQVVDPDTRRETGAIPDTRGVHGTALVRGLNKAYISDGKDTAVTVADLTTLAVLKKIHVSGLNPDAIVYDPFSGCVFTFNGKSGSASVIDTKSDSVVATIPLGGKPEFPAADGRGKLYVNLEDKNRVAVINTKSMRIEKSWPTGPGREPSAMAIDTVAHRLFIGCHNRMMVVMDAVSGRVIATPPIGSGVDAAVFDPGTQRAFSSNGDGTVTVIQQSSGGKSYAVLENIITQKGARTMALNPKSHVLYLPDAEFDAAPAPTTDNPKPRAPVKPGSFMVLEIAPVAK
jgi:YVTN family beta-propeller protein